MLTPGWRPNVAGTRELVPSPNQPCLAVSSATAHRATDDDPPARKAARAMTYATSDESSLLGTSAGVPPAPVKCPFPSNRRRQLLPLPRFAALDPIPDNVQSPSVVTQLYPPFFEDRSSTPCFGLAEFDSECSWGGNI